MAPLVKVDGVKGSLEMVDKKFIDFGSGEVTQGDGWFEMP